MNSSELLTLAVPAGTCQRLERRRGSAERRAVGRNERAFSEDPLRAGAPLPAVHGSKPGSNVSASPAILLLPPDNEMWEVGNVARFLKRSESWVYKKTAAGVLPVHRLDGWGLRYVPMEIRAWAGEISRKKHR